GAYTLATVPTGNVDMQFIGSGLCPGGVGVNDVTQWFNNQPTQASATPVNVETGSPTLCGDAAMVAGGSISGTVTAASGGAGLSGICVGAFVPAVDAVLVASTSTGAGGHYTLDGVPAGDLEVEFFATGLCPGGVPASFAAQWYNQQPAEATANTVTVVSGSTTTNINAAMLAGGSISGTVTAAAGGAGLSGICVDAFTHGIDPPQRVASVGTIADGSYALTGVPAGNVDVQFNSGGFCPGGSSSHFITQWFHAQPTQASANVVHVAAGTDTASVDAAMVSGGSISGTVTAAVGGAGLSGMCVEAFTTDATPQLLASTGTLGAGAYTLDGVPAGNVNVRFNSSGACPGGVHANYVTQWYNNQPISSMANPVNVVLGSDTANVDAALVGAGSITGTVTAAGSATSGVCVGAFVDEALIASTSSKANGTYTLNGVPAGSVDVQFNASGVCPGGVVRNYLTQWYVGQPSEATATHVIVAAGTATPNINAAMVAPTAFTITVNGALSSSIAHGATATLAAAGLPAAATGTVVFNSPGNPNLCTATLPATSCATAAGLAAGAYTPISAAFSDTSGNFTNTTSTNTVALTVAAAPPPPTAPAAPTHAHAVLAAGHVTVSWTAPATDGGSPITSYKVTASSGPTSVTVIAPATQAVITGLAPGTYTFTVRAKNAVGTSTPSAASNSVTIAAPTVAPRVGYWMLGADGHVYGFGDAHNLGNSPSGAVAMAARRDGKGYWVVNARGSVKHFGSAAGFGDSPHLRAGEVVSTISATPSGNGYWLFTNLGHVFAYGDAHFYGDMGSTKLNGSVIASAATATGHGYYMVGSDGGVFTFGDAKFHGSTGAMRLNQRIVGISPTPDNRGYWLVAADGGVFAFGAPFRGSMGAVRLQKPVNGLVAFGNGYLMVASDGGIFNFSNKPFLGSLATHPPKAAIIGIAAFSTGS
ncbi:MAG: Esterase, partial [Actinomycetia bacterium]|nr:Esterase [Actinomycetes bacterium]